MKKFVIMETKGNTNTLVKSFDSKDEALAFGDVYIKTMPRANGVLCCSYTDVDENGHLMSDTEQIYHVWA